MHLRPQGVAAEIRNQKSESRNGHPAFALVTLVPLIWLLSVTMTAGFQKIFHYETRSNFPRIGFLQIAEEVNEKLPALQKNLGDAMTTGNAAAITAAQRGLRANRTLYFNNIVDALVTGIFLVLVVLIVLVSVREWIILLARKRLAQLHESEPVWLPEYALAEGRPLHALGLIALGFALAKELSGEAQMERARAAIAECPCEQREDQRAMIKTDLFAKHGGLGKRQLDQQSYMRATEQRFTGVRRCC